jgi:hypothetical protein
LDLVKKLNPYIYYKTLSIMYVYLIYDKGTKLVKIGKSVNPSKRFKNIRCGNPNTNLFYSTESYTEKELHKKYAHLRVSGEWFNLGIAELEEIMGGDKNVPENFFHADTIKKMEENSYGGSVVRMSTSYVLKWELSDNPHYKFTSDGICINTKTNRVIKKTLCGGSLGYCINGKFVSSKTLRPKLQRIPPKK